MYGCITINGSDEYTNTLMRYNTVTSMSRSDMKYYSRGDSGGTGRFSPDAILFI